jgi:carbon-monoxide dehydrogenase medium subunit
LYVTNVELHECKTLAEASTLLSRHGAGARILAGGTDLLVDLKTGRLAARHLVTVRDVPDLRGISLTDEGLRIGALTTITELHQSPIVRERFAPILDATGRMAAPQIRNLATVGGNIACAVPCADLPPILSVLGASIVVWAAGDERHVPLDAFFVGVRRTVLRAGEILRAVLVSHLPSRFGAAYARFALRDGNAIAVAAVAAGLQLGNDDIIRDARLTLGAVAPTPQTAHRARQALIGAAPNEPAFAAAAEEAMAEAQPITDVRGSASFRRALVGVLTRRALRTGLSRAREYA